MGKNELTNIITDLKLTANLDKEDVVAITVAAFEGKLLGDQKMFKAELKGHEKAVEEINEKEEKALEELQNREIAKPLYASMIKAVEKSGFGKLSLHTGIEDESSGSGAQRKKNPGLVISIQANGELRGHYSEMGKKVTIPLPAQIKKFRKDRDDLRKKISTVGDEIIDCKKQLADIPRKEREARAALAVTILSGSKQGKALLAQLGLGKNLLTG